MAAQTRDDEGAKAKAALWEGDAAWGFTLQATKRHAGP